MPRYCVDYGEYFEFDAQTAGEVVPILQSNHVSGGSDDERSFCRRLAMELCDWNGGDYCFHSRDALARSMIENGVLEEID